MSDEKEPELLRQRIRYADGEVIREGTSIRWKFSREKKAYIGENNEVIEPLEAKTEVKIREKKLQPKPDVKPSNVLNIELRDGEKYHTKKEGDRTIIYLPKGMRFKLDNPSRRRFRIFDGRKEHSDFSIKRSGKAIPLGIILKKEGIL